MKTILRKPIGWFFFVLLFGAGGLAPHNVMGADMSIDDTLAYINNKLKESISKSLHHRSVEVFVSAQGKIVVKTEEAVIKKRHC